MNNKREDFIKPSHTLSKITPYWLLGIMEGEGTFSVNTKTMSISFHLVLTASQASLIHAIKDYLDSIFLEDSKLKSYKGYQDINYEKIFVFERESRGGAQKPHIGFTISQINFIVEKFIPMLYNLSFGTKKYYDFLDWAFIATLIYKGKHTTEVGRELILKLSKRMNDKRLSTFKGYEGELHLEEIPQSLIDEVLSMEDIYIKNSEGLRVKSSDRTLVSGQLYCILAEGGDKLVFKNSEACAKYFGVTSATINNRITKRIPIKGGINSLEFLLYRKAL